jgi:hypothetical protein
MIVFINNNRWTCHENYTKQQCDEPIGLFAESVEDFNRQFVHLVQHTLKGVSGNPEPTNIANRGAATAA